MLGRRLWPLSAVMLVLSACASSAPGWHGRDVHLVDGVWIGTEHRCAGDARTDVRCHSGIAEALRLVGPAIANDVVDARLADLLTTYVTTDGETRTARTVGGVSGSEAVVLDFADGSQRVVLLWCHEIEHATCDLGGFDWWLNGHVPPSYPPGTTFG